MTDAKDVNTYVKKIGDRLVVLLPDGIARQLGLKDNDEVRVIISKIERMQDTVTTIDQALKDEIDFYMIPNSMRKSEVARKLQPIIRENPQAKAYIIHRAAELIRRSQNWEGVHRVAALLFDPFQGGGGMVSLREDLAAVKELRQSLAEKVVQFDLPKTIYDKDFEHVIYPLVIAGVTTLLQIGNTVGAQQHIRLSDAEFAEEKERILRELLG